MFLDELEITVRAGKGGDGCISFLRDAKTLRGGPNGGDGGKGGDVIFLPSTHKNTLYHLSGRRVFAAQNGEQGGAKDCYGKNGDDLLLELPVGTVVLDATHGNLLKDLREPDVPWAMVRGGFGGRGNARFATSTNRTPRTAELGKEGEERHIRLTLKLIADVGLLGLPNAGKSTLLAALTKARPKIAAYPFTTLEPMLGIAEGPGDTTIVIADIPGLIEGASLGKGLGDKFLKHIDRTRLLLHLIDCSDMPLDEPAKAWRVVRAELAGHSRDLAERPSFVVATKVEDEASRARAAALATAIGQPVLAISSVTGSGLRDLMRAAAAMLSELPQQTADSPVD